MLIKVRQCPEPRINNFLQKYRWILAQMRIRHFSFIHCTLRPHFTSISQRLTSCNHVLLFSCRWWIQGWSCTRALISGTCGTSLTLQWLVVLWWPSPSRKCPPPLLFIISTTHTCSTIDRKTLVAHPRALEPPGNADISLPLSQPALLQKPSPPVLVFLLSTTRSVFLSLCPCFSFNLSFYLSPLCL